jgi:hypothetical protein
LRKLYLQTEKVKKKKLQAINQISLSWNNTSTWSLFAFIWSVWSCLRKPIVIFRIHTDLYVQSVLLLAVGLSSIASKGNINPSLLESLKNANSKSCIFSKQSFVLLLLFLLQHRLKTFEGHSLMIHYPYWIWHLSQSLNGKGADHFATLKVDKGILWHQLVIVLR